MCGKRLGEVNHPVLELHDGDIFLHIKGPVRFANSNSM